MTREAFRRPVYLVLVLALMVGTALGAATETDTRSPRATEAVTTQQLAVADAAEPSLCAAKTPASGDSAQMSTCGDELWVDPICRCPVNSQACSAYCGWGNVAQFTCTTGYLYCECTDGRCDESGCTDGW